MQALIGIFQGFFYEYKSYCGLSVFSFEDVWWRNKKKRFYIGFSSLLLIAYTPNVVKK